MLLKTKSKKDEWPQQTEAGVKRLVSLNSNSKETRSEFVEQRSL